MSLEKWFVLDLVYGSDEKPHRASSFVHLHPDFDNIDRKEGGFRAKVSGGRIIFIAQSGCDVSVEEGWYCPEFGKRIKNLVLEMTTKGISPLFFDHLISGGESPDCQVGLRSLKPELFANIKIGADTYQLNDSGAGATLRES